MFAAQGFSAFGWWWLSLLANEGFAHPPEGSGKMQRCPLVNLCQRARVVESCSGSTVSIHLALHPVGGRTWNKKGDYETGF